MGLSTTNLGKGWGVNKNTVTQSKPWPRHRWVSVGVLIAGLLLTILAAMRLGGELPDLPQIRSSNQETSKHPFQSLVNRPDLSKVNRWPAMRNETNPFFTDFFKPAPKPAPPPKPTTKHVEVLYQGWFESSGKELEAFVTIDNKQFSAGPAGTLGSEFTLLEIHSEFIRLKSKDEKEHRVPFSKMTSLEIPIQ